MQFVKTVLILLLTLLWAAASNHCKLEQITSLDFLTCADHAKDAAPQDNSCDTDGCAFESQLYKAENTQESMPAPVLLFAFFLTPSLDELAIPEAVSHVLPDAAPTELARVWQFSHRTALPPRAPSLLS